MGQMIAKSRIAVNVIEAAGGNIQVSGAVSGFKSITATDFSVNDELEGTLLIQDGNGDVTGWEVYAGANRLVVNSLTGSPILTRPATPSESSSGGSKLTIPAGTHTLFLSMSAESWQALSPQVNATILQLADSATPSVAGHSQVAVSATTAITQFQDLEPGQLLCVYANVANAVIQQSSEITTKTGSNITLGLADYVIFLERGGKAFEVMSSVMGSGSGLDADKLDGYQASEFARLDAGQLTFTGFASNEDADVFRLRPDDWGTGKPYLFVRKQADAQLWTWGLWDGTDNSGTIQFSSAVEFTNNATFGGTFKFGSSGHAVTSISNDTTMAGNSSTALATEAAARGFTLGHDVISMTNAGHAYTETEDGVRLWLTETYGYPINNTVVLGVRESNNRQWQLTASKDEMRFRLGHATGTDGDGTGWNAWKKIWTEANDGTGSGLDADRLDGVEGASYARLDQGNVYAGFTSTENATVAVYRPSDFGTDKPEFQIRKEADAQTWRLGLWDGTDTNGTINFQCSALTMSGSTLWHAGNDGSGSGLDADRLDGIEGSVYARVDRSNTFDSNASDTGLEINARRDSSDYGNSYVLFGSPRSSSADGEVVTGRGAITCRGESGSTLGTVWINAATAGLNPGNYGSDSSFRSLQSGLRLDSDGNLEHWKSGAESWSLAPGEVRFRGFTSTVDSDIFQFVPSDYGTNNPLMFVRKTGTSDEYRIGLWDGTNTDGTIAIAAATVAVSGAITATGDVTAGASDERLKTNLSPITGALDSLRMLGAYTYDWNDLSRALGYKPNAQTEQGVLAQEVETVVPSAVAPAPFDENYLTVRYERLVPLLIAAVKELEAKVQDLEARL